MYTGHYEKSLCSDNDSHCHLRKMKIFSSNCITLLHSLLMICKPETCTMWLMDWFELDGHTCVSQWMPPYEACRNYNPKTFSFQKKNCSWQHQLPETVTYLQRVSHNGHPCTSQDTDRCIHHLLIPDTDHYSNKAVGHRDCHLNKKWKHWMGMRNSFNNTKVWCKKKKSEHVRPNRQKLFKSLQIWMHVHKHTHLQRNSC